MPVCVPDLNISGGIVSNGAIELVARPGQRKAGQRWVGRAVARLSRLMPTGAPPPIPLEKAGGRVKYPVPHVRRL